MDRTATIESPKPLCAPEAAARIGAAFKETYTYRTFLKDDAIRAKARNGVLTLQGTVADEAHRTLAQETAANLPGVVRVDNRLATRAEIAAENVDTWTGAKVKLALLFHRNVSALRTTVAVKDGIVTLTGEASSAAQKELTTEYASDIEGVKVVKNEMTIAATPEPAQRTIRQKIDDASVTAQVRMALMTHRSTSAVSVKIETRNGEVSLTGIARNAAEKSLVTKLVTDIRGVTEVKNQMTVEEAKTK